MVSNEVAFDCAEQLSTLKFFPGVHVLKHVATQIQVFCHDDLHAQGMVAQVLAEWLEWKSIAGLRDAAKDVRRPLRDEDSHGVRIVKKIDRPGPVI
jgi:hypothetical protein